MARKKKAKVATDSTVATTPQKIEYQGKLCVKVMCGNKVVSTKSFTNTGLDNLFKFLAHSLAGSFYPDLRPCKIKLYNFLGAYGEASESPDAFKFDTTSNQLEEASPYVMYDATPIVSKDSTSGNYKTTFRFKIPSTWLFNSKYNVVGLFSATNDPCAYYKFTTEKTVNTKTENTWDNQSTEEIKGNFSLIIEWTMEISNK